MDVQKRARFDSLQAAERFLVQHDNGMCWRKVRHVSRSAAQTHLRDILTSPDRIESTLPRQGELNVYPCPVCDGWHVGHHPDPHIVPVCNCTHHAYSHQWASVARVGCALCSCELTRDELYLIELRRLHVLIDAIPVPPSLLQRVRAAFRRTIKTARGINRT